MNRRILADLRVEYLHELIRDHYTGVCSSYDDIWHNTNIAMDFVYVLGALDLA